METKKKGRKRKREPDVPCSDCIARASTSKYKGSVGLCESCSKAIGPSQKSKIDISVKDDNKHETASQSAFSIVSGEYPTTPYSIESHGSSELRFVNTHPSQNHSSSGRARSQSVLQSADGGPSSGQFSHQRVSSMRPESHYVQPEQATNVQPSPIVQSESQYLTDLQHTNDQSLWQTGQHQYLENDGASQSIPPFYAQSLPDLLPNQSLSKLPSSVNYIASETSPHEMASPRRPLSHLQFQNQQPSTHTKHSTQPSAQQESQTKTRKIRQPRKSQRNLVLSTTGISGRPVRTTAEIKNRIDSAKEVDMPDEFNSLKEAQIYLEPIHDRVASLVMQAEEDIRHPRVVSNQEKRKTFIESLISWESAFNKLLANQIKTFDDAQHKTAMTLQAHHIIALSFANVKVNGALYWEDFRSSFKRILRLADRVLTFAHDVDTDLDIFDPVYEVYVRSADVEQHETAGILLRRLRPDQTFDSPITRREEFKSERAISVSESG